MFCRKKIKAHFREPEAEIIRGVTVSLYVAIGGNALLLFFLAHQHKACRQLKIKQEIIIIIMQRLTRHVSVIRMTNRRRNVCVYSSD